MVMSNSYKQLNDQSLSPLYAEAAKRPTSLPSSIDIVIIGDIHGDIIALHKMLCASGVVPRDTPLDETWRWNGGQRVLICLGDYLDSKRWQSSFYTAVDTEVTILNQLTSLQRQAQHVGGRVITLMGNHELMNLGGVANLTDFADVSHRSSLHMFHNSTSLGQHLIETMPTIARVSGVVCVHGGLGGLTVQELSRKGTTGAERIERMNQEHTMKLQANIFDAEAHPLLWSRNVGEDQGGCPAQLDVLLNLLDAWVLVVGHTPQANGISTGCQGKVIRADTGASRAFGPLHSPLLNSTTRRGETLLIDSTARLAWGLSASQQIRQINLLA